MRGRDVAERLQATPLLVDAALAALVAPPLAFLSADLVDEVWIFPLGLGMVAALALRRVRPVLSTAVVGALALLHVVAGHPLLLVDVAVLVALYSVTVHGPAWARRLGLAAGLAGAVLQGAAVLVESWPFPYQTTAEKLGGAATMAVACAVVVTAVWLAGQWRRTRVAYVDSLEDRARRAEREREQQAVIAAAAERARIARDVHDVVTHSLSVMIAQADGGRYAAAASPAAAVGALETVAATGRSALADMQRLLAVLRADPSPGTGTGTSTGARAALAPQPDVGAVPALVAAVRASGLAVDLQETGPRRPLTPAAGLAVYRVVQEALTNVLKHAGPAARARVVLAWSSSALSVCVEDDGRGAAAEPSRSGLGLLGMRERLAGAGGSVQARPRAGGGFAVTATVPVAQEAR
ncbi:sensor histidine kinase [Quadrisphaera sp. DSM 44207]|uniref:sensor histidine kinase n=1 Tax=Quadrisphaera sp. DSM 44207 TaxID=1881057 RepID=UPI0021011665|nr:histidine kinase [Quadrisphaera sp. DSM 44207]